jgi:hypothetical protein
MLSRRVKTFTLAACLSLAGVAVPAAAFAQPTAKANSDASFAYTQAVSHFSVFAEPASAADALPSGSAYAGGTSRRIAGSMQHFSAWGVLKGGQLCVTVDARSGPASGGPAACNSISRLTRPGQILVLGASAGTGAAPQVLAGLTPDGVSSVTVSYEDGSTAAVPVKDNGFAVVTGGRTPRSLRWDNGCRDYLRRAGGNVITSHAGAPLSGCAVTAGSMSLAAANLSAAPRYNGEFCYGVALQEFGSCVSNTVSNIRRAIGHGTYYTFVSISGGSLAKTGRCYSDGCTADTGYLSRDVTGGARIENSGPCSPCWGTYYGWLYP